MSAVPVRLWPAFALIVLWLVALVCNIFGGAIDAFGAFCARVAIPLTFLIVPFTVLSSFVPRENLTKRSIALRTFVAFLLSLVTVMLWPRPNVTYKFVSAAHRVKDIADGPFDLVAPAVLAAIPRGETELGGLPDEVLDQLLPVIDRERVVDPWGHPYMFVAEDRETGLWIGAYSKGRDGVSRSNGNDPDDLNSWSQNGSDYYLREINRRVLWQGAVEFVCAFAFYLPICLLTFRSRNGTGVSRQQRDE